MIANEREYAHTKKKLKELTTLLQAATSGIASDPDFRDLQCAALASQMADLRAETREYERLKSGRTKRIRVESLAMIADALIKARIARGWTQANLADQLGLAEQQVQRYEVTRYSSASLARLCEIAEALHIDINETVTLRAS